jgi:hypothetical protein
MSEKIHHNISYMGHTLTTISCNLSRLISCEATESRDFYYVQLWRRAVITWRRIQSIQSNVGNSYRSFHNEKPQLYLFEQLS